MFFRLQTRSLSRLCKTFFTKKGTKFLEQASGKLSCLKDQQTSSKEIIYWENIASLAHRFTARRYDYEQLEFFRQAKDPELKGLAETDKENLETELEKLAIQLATTIVPQNQFDTLNKCQLELSAGVGGTEAMLFTGDLLGMYEKLAQQKGWQWTALQHDNAQLGGVRSAVILLSGDRVYQSLRFEAGIHRVQRIPLTDKTRMHTSTSSVAVLPEPAEVETYITSKDVKIEAIRASGPGGQYVNKRATAVRIIHKETGISVHCMDERYQHLNLQIAFRRLAAILMQKQHDSLYEKVSASRKLQMGSRARAEKVRTYNFKDDRVTDHRLKKSVNNVHAFLSADSPFIYFIEELKSMFLSEELESVFDAFGND